MKYALWPTLSAASQKSATMKHLARSSNSPTLGRGPRNRAKARAPGARICSCACSCCGSFMESRGLAASGGPCANGPAEDARRLASCIPAPRPAVARSWCPGAAACCQGSRWQLCWPDHAALGSGPPMANGGCSAAGAGSAATAVVAATAPTAAVATSPGGQPEAATTGEV